jgi:AcrR family transcriptional regulator
LAAGTFYLYFDSRQALFDILLPEIALDALQYLSPFVHGSGDLLDLEERGLRGVLEWNKKNPGFPRLRSEAEVAAPSAFQTYLQEILSRYLPALERGQAQGYLKGYDARELTVIAYMLMGARHYIHYSFGKNGKQPEWVVDVYLRFVRGGLLTSADSAKKASSPATKKVTKPFREKLAKASR